MRSASALLVTWLGVMMTVAEPGSSGFWHAALFHHGATEFDTQALRFAQDGARAGAALLVLGPADGLSGLRARLNGLGNQVTWADTDGVCANPGQLISAISRFVLEHTGRATWCVQQVAWPWRPTEELWEVLRHEALLNIALAGAPVRMLCSYDTRLPRDLNSCAETTHPVISHGGNRFQPSPRYRDAVGQVPAECDRPLPPPPAGARALPFAEDLSIVRRLVLSQAQVAGLRRDRAGDLQIAVGELAANTLAHSGGPGTLTMWTTGAEIVCQVSDTGYIADPLAGRILPEPAADRGGRGLWLVHQLCDLVQIRTRRGGTTVRVHMRLL